VSVIALAAFVLCSEIAMAKPPEPLEEIFPATSLIVDAVVVEMKSEDPDTEPQSPNAPRQILELTVNRVVRGKLSADEKKSMKITVIKPKAPYRSRVGIKGAWLLSVDPKTGEKTVLGRYGPDSWSFEKIDAKLKELNPKNLAP